MHDDRTVTTIRVSSWRVCGALGFGLLFLLACVWTGAVAEETPWAVTVPDDRAQPLRPALPDAIRQASLCRDPNGQLFLLGWTPGTDPNAGPELGLWTSADRRYWQRLVLTGVIPNLMNYPKIQWIDHRFWIVYGTFKGGVGLLRSTGDQAQGPYEDQGLLLPSGRDPSLFVEDNGDVYLIYGEGRFVRLETDPPGLSEAPRSFQWRRSTSVTAPPTVGRQARGLRGLFLVKKEGRYILFQSRRQTRLGTRTDDVYVATSEHLAGPYGLRTMALPHAGQVSAWVGNHHTLWTSFNPSVTDARAIFQDRVGLVPLESPRSEHWRPVSSVILERGPVARLRPGLPDCSLRDVCVCVGPDGTYYLTGVGANCHYGGAGIPLWKSRDLQQWEQIEDVWEWDDLDSLDWEPNDVQQVTVRFPRITFEAGARTFLLTMGLQDASGSRVYLYHSASGKPEDPYIPVSYQPISRGQSGQVLHDVGNTWYWITEAGGIARLKDDLTGLAEPLQDFTWEDPQQTLGNTAWLHKTQEGYALVTSRWHGNAYGDGSFDLMACRSERREGPYGPWQLVVPHGGGGMAFVDGDGAWQVVFSGTDVTAPFRNRLGRVRITVRDNGTVEPLRND